MGKEEYKMNMRQEFRQLKRYYQENEFGKIFKHKLGIYFLKMRSISRVELLRRFAKAVSPNPLNSQDISR